MVLGPLLPKQEPRSTIGHFVGMFSEKNVQEGVPAGIFGVCDVRDVADAHLFALTSPDAVGQRIMVTSTATYTTLEVCEAVQRLFPQLPVPSKFKEARRPQAKRCGVCCCAFVVCLALCPSHFFSLSQ
jgi:nucleoside-diphosphate-sugar epimerase